MPTNWAGTPDGPHLDLLKGFAKGIFGELLLPGPGQQKGPILADRAFSSFEKVGPRRCLGPAYAHANGGRCRSGPAVDYDQATCSCGQPSIEGRLRLCGGPDDDVADIDFRRLLNGKGDRPRDHVGGDRHFSHGLFSAHFCLRIGHRVRQAGPNETR